MMGGAPYESESVFVCVKVGLGFAKWLHFAKYCNSIYSFLFSSCGMMCVD